MSQALKENRGLIEVGGAIVVLRKNDKMPVERLWNKLERWSWADAERLFPEGANIGIRLGGPSRIGELYIVGIDMDVPSTEQRHIDEALAALAEIVPEFESLGRVISGSGGESRHGYAVTDEEPRTKTVRQSTEFIVTRFNQKKRAWQIEIGGTGRQFVLPPSIHPETRQPYRWIGGSPDWAELPLISAERIRSWTPNQKDPKLDLKGLSDIAAYYRNRPRWFNDDEVDKILYTLADHRSTAARFIEDYDGWLEIGMCLHHQYEGGEVGYQKWCSFSAASDKFDEEKTWGKWKSFGKRTDGSAPKTMASLKREAEDVLIAEETGSLRPTVEDTLPSDFILAERVEVEDEDDDNPFEFDSNYQKTLRITANKIEDDHHREWTKEYDRDNNGKIRPVVHNVTLIVGNDWRLQGWLGLNEFTGEQVQRLPLKRQSMTMLDISQRDWINDALTKAHDTNLRLFMAIPPVGKRRPICRALS